MSAPAIDPREVLRRLLLRAALAHKVDLGSWPSVDGFLIGAGVVAEDLNKLTDDDLDEVRRRLQRRGALLDGIDVVLDKVEESGLAPLGLAAAIGVSVVVVLRLLQGQAHAAATAAPLAGPPESNLAGLLVSLLPIAIAVVFMVFATRGRPQPADDEAFGDTTGFGERGR